MTTHEIEHILSICRDAGSAILEIYNSDDFNIEIKGDGSPLTRADKKSHEIIAEGLKNTDFPILSEEGKSIAFEERNKWNEFWMIDPIDGTKEFIKRNGDFTINIALIKNNNPVFGIVYVPVDNTVYLGDAEHGSYKFDINDEDWKNKKNTLPFKIEREYTVVASRSHLSVETEDFIEELKTDNPNLEIKSRGSSLKLCMVAEGLADIYPRFAPTMEWDTAAGHAVCSFAGKRVFEYNKTTELVYNKENLLNPWFIVK
ncbi:MAG: 3'(2'),5'-bisphosphate nucleotidase CysQ [Bacteroidota bacterium]